MKLPFLGAIALFMAVFHATLPGQHPSGYGEVKGRTHTAVFSFPGLEREVLHSYPASFFALEQVTMRFRLLVRPDGTVKYVKPILDPSIPAEFRMGGAHALYKYRFAPLAEEAGDQWVETTMEVGKKPPGN